MSFELGFKLKERGEFLRLTGSEFQTYYQFSSVQFSSVNSRWKAHMRSTPSLRSFPNAAFETVPMLVWLTMPSSQGRSLSASSFYATPLSSRRSMVWCPWTLCPQIVPPAPQHFKSSETQAAYDACFFPPFYLLCRFLWLLACPGQYTHRIFRRRMSNMSSQSGLPIPQTYQIRSENFLVLYKRGLARVNVACTWSSSARTRQERPLLL